MASTWLQLKHFIMSHTQQVQSYFRCNKESAKNDSEIQGQFDNLCEWIEWKCELYTFQELKNKIE